jgi:hypothetical protein
MELPSLYFGPTLLAWMQRRSPAVYQAILEADRERRRRQESMEHRDDRNEPGQERSRYAIAS